MGLLAVLPALALIPASPNAKKKCRGAHADSPFVLKEGGRYRIWYSCRECGSDRSGICHATSQDGFHWETHGKNPVLGGPAGEGVASPSVMRLGGVYHMWFSQDGGGLRQIGYAVSKDGVHWKKHDKGPVLGVGEGAAWDSKSLVAPHVLRVKGRFLMWYQGSRRLDQDRSGIGLAFSNDGIHWRKYEDNPVLSPQAPPHFADRQVGDPAVIYDEDSGSFRMWFSGGSFKENDRITRKVGKRRTGHGKKIGYGVSRDGIAWEVGDRPLLDIPDWRREDPKRIPTRVDAPFVLVEEGLYRMWFGLETRRMSRLVHAASKDDSPWSPLRRVSFAPEPLVGIKGKRNFLLIGWDGVRRDRLTGLLRGGSLPNLRRLIDEGAFVKIRAEEGRAQTKPGWSQILTGYSAGFLEIEGNGSYRPVPRGLTVLERIERHLGEKNVVTIFIGGKGHDIGARGPHSVCVNCVRRDIVTGAETGWFEEIVSGLTKDGSARRFVPREGEPFHHLRDRVDVFENDLGHGVEVGRRALRLLGRYKDERFFAFIHFEEPDEQAHRFGEDSKEYSAALMENDMWLGRIVAELKNAGIYDKTFIFVTTDHGVDKGGRSHRYARDIFLASNFRDLKDSGDRRDIAPTILDMYGIGLEALDPPPHGSSLLKR